MPLRALSRIAHLPTLPPNAILAPALTSALRAVRALHTSSLAPSSPSRLLPSRLPYHPARPFRLFRPFSTGPFPPLAAIDIFFGSTTGTAQSFADDLALQLSSLLRPLPSPPPVRVLDLASAPDPLTALKPDRLAIFVVACYGTGEPTDNAKQFYDALMRLSSSSSSFPNVRYAVFGLGNSRCFKDHFNAVGKNVEKKLSELGAVRVADLGLGDDSGDIEADFESWCEGAFMPAFNSLLSAEALPTPATTKQAETPAAKPAPMQHSLPAQEQPPTAEACPMSSDLAFTIVPERAVQKASYPPPPPVFPSAPVAPLGADPGESERVPLRADVMLNEQLIRHVGKVDPARPDYCHHVAFRIPRSLRYEPGDHIGIYPHNLPAQAQEVVEYFKGGKKTTVDAHRVFYHAPSNTHFAASFEDLFRTRFALAQPNPVLLKKLAEWISGIDPAVASKIRRLSARNEFQQEVAAKSLSIPQVIAMFPELVQHVTASEANTLQFINMLGTIKPRLYSISSSQNVHPEEVHATVRLHYWYDASCDDSRLATPHFGLCSSYVRQLKPGEDSAYIYIRKSLFHLPKDVASPVVMIAAGTGIAPYISFLEERLAIKRAGGEAAARMGPAMLFVGCRSPEHFLYKDFLKTALREGALTQLEVAYSLPGNMDGTKPLFLHECVKQNGSSIWEHALEPAKSGSIYVCGGATGFGEAIRKVIGSIVAHGETDPKKVDDAVRYLSESGRYMEDLD